MMKKIVLLAIGFLAAAVPAFAASSINPNVPATNAPLASAPVRANFLAAYNDVNNILSKFGSSVAPALPTTRQDWINTSGTPWVWNIYDGAQWVQIGTLNPLTHVFTASGAGAVASVFGRTGVVVAATNDYTFAQIGSTPTTLAGYGITDGVSLTGTQTLTNKTLTAPIMTAPVLGTPASGNASNLTGYLASNLAGLGTGVATALAAAVSGSGSICLSTGSACGGGGTGANPTATIGASPVNGVATTFMRSDAAPPLPATLPALSGVNLTALNGSNIASGTVATGRLPVGKSVVAVNSVLESTLPPQTVTGASKTFATADIQLETRRSNSGTAMTDTFPASTDPGAVNGARITLNNADGTASDTITPGSGTSISSCSTVPPGRSVTFVYELSTTTWRTTFNTCTAAIFQATALGTLVPGNFPTIANATGGVQDSGISSTAIPTKNLATTLNAKTAAYTIATTDAGKINYLNNASPFTFTVPAAGTLGAGFATDLGNIGAGLLSNTLASGNWADTGNPTITTVAGQELFAWVDAGAAGVHSWVSSPPLVARGIVANNTANKDYGASFNNANVTALLAGNLAAVNVANNFTAPQSNCITPLTAVSNVFTPDGTCNNYSLTLGATNTLANWSAGMVAGTTGWIKILQDGTGGRTIGTYGSQINSPGGTASNTFSAGANAWDMFSYTVTDSTHVWFAAAGLNASH